jgi:hypothetical protein
MIEATWSVVVSLAPSLLLGAAIAGLLHVLLPPDFLSRHLRGRAGVVKSVLLGVPLPLCSCGVLPAGLGLKKDGASDGATVGFLISTPQTGVDSILVSASFLGWPFALFKVVSAAVTGVVGGLLADATGADHAEAAAAPAACAVGGGRSLRGAVEHGVDLLRMIWRWLVFGILVSAAIQVFVPDAVFASFAGLGALGAAVAALAVSLPLYVCATASVPIAAALVAGGMPAGAALVFLMAGPATNAATVGALYRALGARLLSIYLAVLVVGSIGFALAFDFLLGGEAQAHAAHHHEGAAPWQVALAVLLLGLLAWFALEDLRRGWRRFTAARAAKTAGAPTTEIAVEGMSCNGCVRHLEETLLASEHVEAAEVSLEPARAVVRGTASEAEIRQLVAAAGYRAVG